MSFTVLHIRISVIGTTWFIYKFFDLWRCVDYKQLNKNLEHFFTKNGSTGKKISDYLMNIYRNVFRTLSNKGRVNVQLPAKTGSDYHLVGSADLKISERTRLKITCFSKMIVLFTS